jgi:hypothetical protein
VGETIRDKPNDKPIVIMGTGIPAVCAIINKLVDIAYNAPDNGPAINVFVLDTMDQVKPDESGLYPLNGRSIDTMHPFKTEQRPEGFPSFGEYAREIAMEDSGWKSALLAPTYGQVNEYLEFMLELSIRTVSDKAYIDSSNKPVKSIEETVANGAATIHFEDGTVLHAKQILRAGEPPHMSGPHSTAGDPSLVSEARRALIASELDFEEAKDGSCFVFKAIVPIVLVTHERDEISLIPRIHLALETLEPIKASELWIVTRETVSALVASTFKGQSIRFLTLGQFIEWMGLMKSTGLGAISRS